MNTVHRALKQGLSYGIGRFEWPGEERASGGLLNGGPGDEDVDDGDGMVVCWSLKLSAVSVNAG